MDKTWTDLQGGNWADPNAWSPSGAPGSADTALITSAGTYGVLIGQSETVGALAVSDPNATILVSELAGAPPTTFAIAGGMTLDAGTLELAGASHTGLGLGGSIYTIDTPATLALSGGIGTSAGAAGGAIAARIATLDLIGSQTIDNVTLVMSDSVELQASAGTTTFGPGFVLEQTGSLDGLDGSLINRGRIDFAGAPWVQIGGSQPSDLANDGTITTGPEEVLATLRDFANAGLLDIAGAFELNVAGSYANSGTIAVAAGATFDLTADTTLAGLGRIDNSGGEIGIGGTLDLGGGTLALAPGGPFSDLLLSGTVRGGTIAPAGGKLAVQSGTFDAVTYAGRLDLSALGTLATLDVVNGLSVQAGTVDVTGAGDTLQFLDSETLDHLTLNLGSAAGSDAALRGDPTGTLALGPDTVLNGAGGQMTVSADAFVNQGRIAEAGGVLGISATTTLTNAGTIVVGGTASGATLQAANLSNSGSIAIGAGDTLVLQSVTYDGQPAPAGFTNTGTIQMTPGSELVLDTSTTLARLGAVGGSGGTLEIAPRQNWFSSHTGGVLDLGGGTLVIGGASPFSELILDGTIENGVVLVMPGGTLDPAATSAETNVVQQAPCYLAGTRLRTPRGDVAVEQLAVGEDLLTAAGEAKPIVWIGHRQIDCRRHPQPQLVRPVRVRAGAFGPSQPQRDLMLSPDHSVSVAAADGSGKVLIPIKHLVNGLTVLQEPADSAHYFHIELARHDILLAEGLPAESYLDTGNRAMFVNAGPGPRSGGSEPVALHPDFWAKSWANACAPLRQAGPDVEAVRRRLLARARSLGRPSHGRAALHLMADGRAIAPASVQGRLHRFLLPDGTRDVSVATDMAAQLRTVCIGSVVLNGRVLDLASAAFGPGFHPMERGAGAAWRRADDRARLSLPGARGRLVLELLLRDGAPAREQSRLAA